MLGYLLLNQEIATNTVPPSTRIGVQAQTGKPTTELILLVYQKKLQQLNVGGSN
jgi:hypothetical protein